MLTALRLPRVACALSQISTDAGCVAAGSLQLALCREADPTLLAARGSQPQLISQQAQPRLAPSDLARPSRHHYSAAIAAAETCAVPGAAQTSSTDRCSGASALPADALQSRSFFGGGTSAAKHRTHKERRLMGYTQQQMFSVVADVDEYKHFVPWCRHSQVTKRIDDSHFEADLEVGFQMFSERYKSKVMTDEPKLVVSEAADSAVFNYLKFTWHFAPGPTAKTTWTSFAVDYDFKNALYTQTSTLFFDQVVSKMIGAFDRRCKYLYGSGA